MMRRVRSLGSSLALMVVAAATLAPPAAPADAAAPSCHGVPATKVGGPKANMLGSHGRDVIVSNGARQVRTNGGDDLVCITGRAPYTKVLGEDGDETVYVETGSTVVSFIGRLGSDTYVGGDNTDIVLLRLDGDDRVSTGAGADTVDFDHAPDRGRLRVSLGSGDDSFHAFAGAIKGRIDAGAGTDQLSLSHDSRSRWVWNNRRGKASTRGETRFRWRRFEQFDLSFFDVPSLTFLGGNGAESVTHQDSGDPTPVFHFQMGGGDDRVHVSSRGHGSLVGGAGLDELDVGVNSPTGLLSLTADLTAHAAYIDYASGKDYAWTLAGVEDLTALAFPTVSLRGDDADNVLVGGAGNDTLVGNGGTDTVDGNAGDDSCEAEVETECES